MNKNDNSLLTGPSLYIYRYMPKEHSFWNILKSWKRGKYNCLRILREKYGSPSIQQSRPNSGYFIATENQCYIMGRKQEAAHLPTGRSPILHKQIDIWGTSFRYGGQTK